MGKSALNRQLLLLEQRNMPGRNVDQELFDAARSGNLRDVRRLVEQDNAKVNRCCYDQVQRGSTVDSVLA